MKARNTLFAVLMLSLPAISAEHSEMKMTDMSTSASSQEYMAGMKDMHDKMMAAVNESDPDKAFAKGMVAHHEGAIAMAETELKYGGSDSNLLIVLYVQIMPDDLVMQLHRF